MFLTVSFLSALAGIGFAGAAALLPDTGIDGTLGAFLALTGAVMVTVTLGFLLAVNVHPTARGIVARLAALVATLTALAAWFLMQDALLATMVVTLLTVLAGGMTADRKIIK